MKVTTLIMLVFFAISHVYAHPNHMSFEQVKHDEQQIHKTQSEADKIIHHRTVQETTGHDTRLPCNEQHKTMPCDKK